MIHAVRDRGESTEVRDGLLALDRNGFPEEAYFDYAYSPIRDESGGIGGIFAACGETTKRVIGERRLRLLRELGTDVGLSRTMLEAYERAVATLARALADVAFVAIYDASNDGTVSLAASARLGPAQSESSSWPTGWLGRTSGPA